MSNNPDVERMIKQRKNLSKGFSIQQDFQKKVTELRKLQIPKMLEARKEGKTSFL